MVDDAIEYFRLATGPVTLGIRFDIPGYTETMGDYFTGYASQLDMDLKMDFTLVDHATIPDIPQSLIQSKSGSHDGFSIADGLFRGLYDPDSDKWNIGVKFIVTKGQTTRVFEQFFYQAFYSACARKSINAFLLHSSGITVGPHGFLFVGASGMGKSTITELSRAYGVMNDEMNILSQEADGLHLHRSPFNAYCTGKNGMPSRLRAVFLLRHAPDCRLQPVSAARAVAELTGQVVPPLGLEDEYTPAVASEMMDIALRIVKAVPVYHLYFPVHGGFWPLILKTCV